MNSQQGDDKRADLELSQAVGVWPDTAVLSLVRSELLARGGHYNEAAQVLDDSRTALGEKAQSRIAVHSAPL